MFALKASSPRYYWDGDVHALAEDYEALHHAASFGSTQAVKTFNDWKARRLKFIETIQAVSHPSPFALS